MRVLFDNGTPRGVASALLGHTVEEARSRGWDILRNGELLDAAEATGFDVIVTTDRNLRRRPAASSKSRFQSSEHREPVVRPAAHEVAQMPYAATVLNVMIASPSDVRLERQAAHALIHE